MNAVARDKYLIREEPIPRLERIVFALSQAAKRCGDSSPKISAALRVALSARCERCGEHITGDELLVLSGLPAAQEDARIKRLRAGRCARRNCRGDLYQLIFQNHPDLDWPKLFAGGDETAPLENPEVQSAEPADIPNCHSRWRAPVRVGIVIAAALLLFVLRQLHYGGRIPLIREPEKFRVDPAPMTNEMFH